MKPTLVFLDASYLEGQYFQFGKEPLSLLTELATEGFVKILTVDIAQREVEHRIQVKSSLAIEELRRARNSVAIAGEERKEPFFTLLKDRKWEPKLESGLIERYRHFNRSCSAITIPVAKSATTTVFNAYFSAKPPFDGADKKAEFPDAFVIETLKKWRKANPEKIYIVSRDLDFHKALHNVEGFSVEETLEPVLRIIYGEKIGHNQAAEALIKRARRRIGTALEQAFKRLLIFMDSEEYTPSDDITVDSVVVRQISKVSVKGLIVTARLEVEVLFTVTQNLALDSQETLPISHIHSVFGEKPVSIKLPATVVFTMTPDLKKAAKVNQAEINDGNPLDLVSIPQEPMRKG